MFDFRAVRIVLQRGVVQIGTRGKADTPLVYSGGPQSRVDLRYRGQGVFGGGDELLEDLQRDVELEHGDGEFLGGIPKKDLGDMPVVMVQFQPHAFAL